MPIILIVAPPILDFKLSEEILTRALWLLTSDVFSLFP